MWTPNLAADASPRYRAIADQLGRDIASGNLAAGARLPTHRALATQIGVTVGTVSRAYAEAARLGLISGEVGRGTFVREQPLSETPFDIPDDEREALIDLSRNVPDPSAAAAPLREALAALTRSAELVDLLDYLPSAGSARHRAAGASWVGRSGLATNADEIVVTGGAQHAMWLALATLAKPGDTVLAAELTYPGLIGLTRLLRLRLEGLALDEEGIRPDALEAACRAHAPRVLYCIPTNQNPTAAVMSEGRRREIAAIAQRYDLALIEDDICGFLQADAPLSLSSFAPEQSFYVTSLSKCIAPGLRVGFLRAPSAYTDHCRRC